MSSSRSTSALPQETRSPTPNENGEDGNLQTGTTAVLRNRPFLLLWLAQVATQMGYNMVIFALTVMVSAAYGSATAVSALLLSFLLPSVLFSAVAGVFVDRVDKRTMLVATNVLRGMAFLAMFAVGGNLALLYLLVIFSSTVASFFAPAEASMIPLLVPKRQLLAANGLFTLTMNAAFALGFALLGPSLVALSSPQSVILIVAVLHFVGVGFCWVLPAAPPAEKSVSTAGQTVADAERAVETTVGQFVEGISYIRAHHNVLWSLSYLGVAGALVGVLGALGPGFAKNALGIREKDLVVVVLPLGVGIVVGILTLNWLGRFIPRRRAIEIGLIGLGILLAVLSVVGPVARFLQGATAANGLSVSGLVSLLSIVIALAFLVGCGYAVVAILAQTQLQEDLPPEVRGRVFGVLNMLVSVASLLPIAVLGPMADVVGYSTVILGASVFVFVWGLASIISRGHLRPAEVAARARHASSGAPVDPLTAATSPTDLMAVGGRPGARKRANRTGRANRAGRAGRARKAGPSADGGPGAMQARAAAEYDDGEAPA